MRNLPSNLLQIPPPKNKSHIIWEHAMKSVFAMAGTFALLFFIPLFAGGKNSGRGRSNDWAIDFIVYMAKHPAIQVGICVLVALAYNIYIFYTHKKRNYVVGLSSMDEKVALTLTNLYYQRTVTLVVPLKNLEYKVITKTSDIDGKTTNIHFVEKDSQNIVGVIKPGHVIWSKHKKPIMEALYQLHLLGVKSTRVKKGGQSSVETFFK